MGSCVGYIKNLHMKSSLSSGAMLGLSISVGTAYLLDTVQIPFETRCLNIVEPTGLMPTVEVSVLQDDGSYSIPQRVLLDAGSSKLAFCNSSLQGMLSRYKTDLKECQRYAGGSAFEGVVYQGEVHVHGMGAFNTNFSVMTMQEQMTCSSGFNGIMGIAMGNLNNATKLPLPSDLSQACPKEDIPMPGFIDVAGIQSVGLSWDVTDTSHISSNITKGTVQLGRMSEITTKADARRLRAQLNTTSGFYGINVLSISAVLPNGSKTNITAKERWFDCTDGNCVFDTGNSKITLPMSARAQLFGCSAPSDACKNRGVISFELEGANGGPSVTVHFNATELGKPLPVCSDNVSQLWDGGLAQAVTFGLPFWASYDTVFDIGNQVAVIVSKEASTSIVV